jgi:exopolysaccharide biosynthesis protein
MFRRCSFIVFLWLILSAFAGVEYRHVVTDEPQSIHILEVDPKITEIMAARALDDGIGRETVSSMVKRHGAFAGINGGFFKIGTNFDGLSMGALLCSGSWYALPHKARGVIGWNKDRVVLDQVLAECCVIIGDKKIYVESLNRPRKAHEAVLYSRDFHRTTLTEFDCFEVLIKDGQVVEVRNSGSSYIPEGGYVLSLSSPEQIAIGEKVDINIKLLSQTQYTTAKAWEGLDNVVGGAPLLIRDSKKITEYILENITIENFIVEKYARTALGILSNGNWLFVVVDGKQPGLSLGMTLDELADFMYDQVDGKQPGLSLGMTLDELADFMYDQGCVEALNMDGGGSATMVVDGAVVNNPYGDEDEDGNQATVRRVSDSIVIR